MIFSSAQNANTLRQWSIFSQKNNLAAYSYRLQEELTATAPLRLGTRYRLKIQRLLEALALGMKPQHPWSGIADIPPNFTLGKRTPHPATFQPYDITRLRSYLYIHTSFELPSPFRLHEPTSEDCRLSSAPSAPPNPLHLFRKLTANNHTPEQRCRNMAAIKVKNTKPEVGYAEKLTFFFAKMYTKRRFMP